MAKDATATMGGLLPDDAGGRDAVHIAVFSAVSKELIRPGLHVGIVTTEPNGDTVVGTDVDAKPIGIVDPFLGKLVVPGNRFWVYLYPRSITGLTHKWSHPAFEDTGTSYAPPNQKLQAEAWLRNWAASADMPGYEWFMAQVAEIADGYGDGDYMHSSGRGASGEIPDEAWIMAEIVLGRPLPQKRPSYFSCSC